MPIPERGPVSLIPDQTQTQETPDARQAAQREEPDSDAPARALVKKVRPPSQLSLKALRGRRIGAMNSDELETAGDVDFSKLGEEQKAEVTETFANAIQREMRLTIRGRFPPCWMRCSGKTSSGSSVNRGASR